MTLKIKQQNNGGPQTWLPEAMGRVERVRYREERGDRENKKQ